MFIYPQLSFSSKSERIIYFTFFEPEGLAGVEPVTHTLIKIYDYKFNFYFHFICLCSADRWRVSTHHQSQSRCWQHARSRTKARSWASSTCCSTSSSTLTSSGSPSPGSGSAPRRAASTSTSPRRRGGPSSRVSFRRQPVQEGINLLLRQSLDCCFIGWDAPARFARLPRLGHETSFVWNKTIKYTNNYYFKSVLEWPDISRGERLWYKSSSNSPGGLSKNI